MMFVAMEEVRWTNVGEVTKNAGVHVHCKCYGCHGC
jgi:hypothetical protein